MNSLMPVQRTSNEPSVRDGKESTAGIEEAGRNEMVCRKSQGTLPLGDLRGKREREAASLE